MPVLLIFLAITVLVIIVVSVVAIVMSTSGGADWTQSAWKSLDQSRQQPRDEGDKTDPPDENFDTESH